MDDAPDRLALGAFVGAVLIGGSNFVAIRYSNRELDPLWGATLRFGLAAAVFGVLCAALRLPLPRGRVLGLLALYGLLGFAAAYGCLYWALQEVPAGIGAVVLAVGPLLVLLLAVAHGTERFSVRALAGALVALVGSVVIFFQPSEIAFGWGSLVLLAIAALVRVRGGRDLEGDRPGASGGDELRRDDRRRGRAAGGVRGSRRASRSSRGGQDAARGRSISSSRPSGSSSAC